MTIDEIKQTAVELWDEMGEEDREYFLTTILLIPANWIAIKYWKRKGAPEWAARAVAALSTSIYIAPYRHAYQQRQIVKRVELAKHREQIKRSLEKLRGSGI